VAQGELVAGKYRVERVLGEGGMGIVLAARHEALGTDVAIKLLRSEALRNTDVIGRFIREARAAVSLKSEHVARVFDVGNLEDGRPYIVMERLQGKDLGAVIDEGPEIGVHDAVAYVIQACEAIAEAHSAGIVHRDLKPSNLFLTTGVGGRPLVKVLDFGISKVAAGSPEDMQLTKTAEVIGSPSYMSPEQLRSSRNVDARTDIWALGVILYELLTRRVPFHAETVTELVLRVVTEREPSIRSIRPDVPEDLEAIVARCMQKQPEARYQSVLELVQALEPYAPGQPSTVSDRVRAVASSRQAPHPLAPAQSALPVPSTSSGRVNVHGGTSVAWGETQPLASAQPHIASSAPPKKSNAVLLMVGAFALLVLGVGGATLLRKSPTPPPALGNEPNLPLPSGRKDLPPVPTASFPVPTPTASDAPAASALPETRKPTPPPVVKTAPPKSAPTPKTDDLSNIGRR
jgi:serine/threonine-protein kinase